MNTAIKNVLAEAAKQINIKEFETTEAFMQVLYTKIFAEGPVKTPEPEPVAAPVAVPEAPVKKPRAKKEKDPNVNLDKINPTQTKKIKAISEELKVEVDKKALLVYLNGMTADEFNAKKFEEHVRSFASPAPVEVATPEPVETEAIEVDFDGKTYLVFADKKVFNMNEDGEPSVLAGHVGMGAFKKMEMPVF
jgi:hypothetical protein